MLDAHFRKFYLVDLFNYYMYSEVKAN